MGSVRGVGNGKGGENPFVPKGYRLLSVEVAAQAAAVHKSAGAHAPLGAQLAGLQRLRSAVTKRLLSQHQFAPGHGGVQDYQGVFRVALWSANTLQRVTAFFGVIPAELEVSGRQRRKVFLVTPLQGTAFLAALARETAFVLICKAPPPVRPVTQYDLLDVNAHLEVQAAAASPAGATQLRNSPGRHTDLRRFMASTQQESLALPFDVKHCVRPLLGWVQSVARASLHKCTLKACEPVTWNFLHQGQYAHWSRTHVNAVLQHLPAAAADTGSSVDVTFAQPSATQQLHLQTWLQEGEQRGLEEWMGPWPHQLPHWAHEADMPVWHVRGWRAVWHAAGGRTRVGMWSCPRVHTNSPQLLGLTFPSAGHVPQATSKQLAGGYVPGMFDVVWAHSVGDARCYPGIVVPLDKVPLAVEREWDLSPITLPMRLCLWWLGHRSYGFVASSNAIPFQSWDGTPGAAGGTDAAGVALQLGRCTPSTLSKAGKLAQCTGTERAQAWTSGALASM